MKKIGLIILYLMLLATPVCATEWYEAEGIENSMSDISLQVTGNKVHITGANSEVLEIFNLTGVKVSTIRIDNSDKAINLNLPKGCYLLKVGKIVRKISIR